MVLLQNPQQKFFINLSSTLPQKVYLLLIYKQYLYYNTKTKSMYHSNIIKNLHRSSILQDEASLKQIRQIHRQVSLPIPNNSLCIICCSNKVNSYCKNYFTCLHNQLCLGCLITFAEHCLLQNNNVKCPTSGCPGELRFEDKQVIGIFPSSLSKKIVENYSEDKLKNNKKCTRPNCYGFINNGTCDLCLNNFCEECYDLQHRGKCEKSEFVFGESIKMCPNCGEGIQKDGGCLHIQCLRCKHNFCFHCLKQWNRSHHITCGTGQTSWFTWIAEAFGRTTTN